MILRIGRVLAAVLMMLIFLADVRPAAASLFSPINSVTHTVTKTTKTVAKASVSTVKTVVAAPINLVTKVGKTLTGKK